LLLYPCSFSLFLYKKVISIVDDFLYLLRNLFMRAGIFYLCYGSLEQKALVIDRYSLSSYYAQEISKLAMVDKLARHGQEDIAKQESVYFIVYFVYHSLYKAKNQHRWHDRQNRKESYAYAVYNRSRLDVMNEKSEDSCHDRKAERYA